MLYNNSSFRYDTLYKGPFDINWHCTNGTVTLKCGAIKIMYNIRRINIYT